MSEPHREALGHLLYGLGEGGGFVQLTGEVGTGKTTICRTLLGQLPENVDVALIFNSKLTVTELLQTICEELHIEPAADGRSTKAIVDCLYAHLLDANARGRRTILIIDEAQNLSSEVLEQIRLLTNLETNENKLLQIFLIGQPELRSVLAREDLRQLAQRITARYHLQSLSRSETEQYIRHRLSVAGCERSLFEAVALRHIYRLSGGIPRLINSLCDRALLGAYVAGRECVDARTVRRAHRELRGEPLRLSSLAMRYAAPGCAALAVLIVGMYALNPGWAYLPNSVAPGQVAAANPDASDGLLERAGTPPVAHAGNAGPPATQPEGLMSIAALVPGEDEISAQVPPVPHGISPSGNAPPLQARAERTLDGKSSAPRSIAAQPPIVAPESETLAERLDSVGNGASFAAEQRLFALWGIPESPWDGDLCATVADRGLVCFAKSGSWDKLRGFDLPALLTLRRDGPDRVRALLIGLVGQDATIYLGGKTHIYRLHEVDRYWTGQFTLLWKPPLEQVTVILPSHSGEPVQWLRTLFARVDGVKGEAQAAGLFDAKLANRIKDFQRRRGLLADGIAGPETLIHLSTVIHDSAMPSLSAATVSTARGVTPSVAYLRH